MANKLLLIDGTGMLSSCFFANYGQDIMRNSKGVITNAVFGMTLLLNKVLAYSGCSHVAVVWDVNRNTFRRVLYKDYKANRGSTPPELKEQLETMKDLLKSMNIFQISIEGYEADDIVGSLAKKYEVDMPVLLVSKDKDYFQLLSERTRLWLNTSKYNELKELYYGSKDIKKIFNVDYKVPDNFFEYTIDNIEFLYGVKNSQVIDYKAIIGDKSDNIPGVAGVGEKSAIPLLKEFGTVENVYDYIEDDNISEKEKKELVKELGISRNPFKNMLLHKENALISKELATIKTDIEEIDEVKLEDLVFKLDYEGRNKKYIELEFNSLLK